MNTPQEFTLYLPKKARISANISKYIFDVLVHFDSSLKDDITPQHAKHWFNELIKESKEVGNIVVEELKKKLGNKPDNLLFVDYYDGYLVFFDCFKSIEAIKKYTYDTHKINIVIKKIVITDSDKIETSDDQTLYKPCTCKDTYTDFPATYVFETPI
jgi:hypothetical protein